MQLGVQDKSSSDRRYSSPCLHIQKIAPTCATISPNSAQRHDDISVSQHRFGGTTFEPHASAASHADINVGARDDEVRSKLGRVPHRKRAVRCSLTSVHPARRLKCRRAAVPGPQCGLRFTTPLRRRHRIRRSPARLLGCPRSEPSPGDRPTVDRRSGNKPKWSPRAQVRRPKPTSANCTASRRSGCLQFARAEAAMMGASDRHGMATDFAHVTRRHGGTGSPTDGWRRMAR